MKLGILDPRTLDAGFQTQQAYESAVKEITNPSWRTKLIKAVSPSTHKAKVSDTLTNLLYETAYNNLNNGEPDADLLLKCFQQGAELQYLDTTTLGTLLKTDTPELKPYIKQVLDAAISEDAFTQAYFNVARENDIAKDISQMSPEIPYQPRMIEEKDITRAQATTVIALFNDQYSYDADKAMNPTIASYLREAIAEHKLDMQDTFADTARYSVGYQCTATIAKDFLSICDQPNALSDARAPDQTVEKEFLEVCINSGMDGKHLTEAICNANQNIYSYGIELADAAFKAGAKPTELLSRKSDWYRFPDEDGAITKNLVENGAPIEQILKHTIAGLYVNQNQFNALWNADPIETNRQLVAGSVNGGTPSAIDEVFGMIEAKGAEPNFSKAHQEETLMLRQDDQLYPYTEKLVSALEKQGLFDEFKQEMLSFSLRYNDTDGIDNLIKKGAVLDDKTIKNMVSGYSDDESYTESIAHIVTAHNYKPTPAIKAFCAKDPEITKLFRNLETKDRLEERLQPKEQIHRPVAKKRQGQTWKI